ncbi:MAG: DUF485 domain-containing protein [Proteobacteria bacterium]|nr:DUF485 domain-containing protein [Pseudomonadota bacterium]
MPEDLVERVRRQPQFRELTRKRSVFAWTLAVAMLVIYYGFITVIAFWPTLLAAPLVDGGIVTLGFPLGIGVIVTAIVLTGAYVWRANTEFDRLNERIWEAVQ